MRLTFTLFVTVIMLAGSLSLTAQDLHNSLFYMNPLHMNPAFSGAYEGTFRIGGIYRDQSRFAVGKSAYSTPTIFIDAPVIMVGKRSWLGAGLLVFQDQTGDGQLRTTAGQISGALHLALDKKSQNVLTVGVQWGRVGRSIEDLNQLQLGAGDYLAQVQAGTPSPATLDAVIMTSGSGSQNSDLKTDFSDINAGVLYKSKMSKTTDLNFGFSVRHITSPGRDYNFQASSPDLPMRFTLHGQLNTELNDKWTLTPEVYFSNIQPASQLQLHGWTGYKLKPEKNIKLNFGLGYRNSDAGQVLLGLDYGDLKAQLAYDITLSAQNNVNSYQGGFEIAVYYIGKIFKKPEVKPAILCPHL